MVEIPDIKNEHSLRAWLEDQPRDASVWIASRSAARVMPVWWHSVLTEDWALKRELTALPILRCQMISSIAGYRPSKNIRNAASAAARGDANAFGAVDNIADPPHHDSASDPSNVADASVLAALAAAHPASNNSDVNGAAAIALLSSANAAHVDAMYSNAVKTDAEQARFGALPDALPLWPDGQDPFEKKWSDIKAQVAASPDAADWRFWIDWYDAQLAGRTMLPDSKRTWDMLEKIALIDPATWDAGPEVVNPEIREIWELYRLRVEVAALQAEKEAFLAARASEVQRSHNQPPDGLVDESPEVARQITIIWDSLDEAHDELEQDAPDKGRLREIAKRLLSALSTTGKYVGVVVGAGVLSMSVEFGKKAGNELADLLIENERLMQFARDLLTYASGG